MFSPVFHLCLSQTLLELLFLSTSLRVACTPPEKNILSVILTTETEVKKKMYHFRPEETYYEFSFFYLSKPATIFNTLAKKKTHTTAITSQLIISYKTHLSKMHMLFFCEVRSISQPTNWMGFAPGLTGILLPLSTFVFTLHAFQIHKKVARKTRRISGNIQSTYNMGYCNTLSTDADYWKEQNVGTLTIGKRQGLFYPHPFSTFTHHTIQCSYNSSF